MPRVSVIIPTYNCSQYLPEAIDSVLAQTCQDFEIVIVDDGSTDNTKDIIEVMSRKFPGKLLYLYQKNKGVCAARNIGIKASTGDYVAFLDADDRWMSPRLQVGVDILESMPDVSLVHANITRINENGQVLSTPTRDSNLLTGKIFKRLFLHLIQVSTPTVLIRKEVLNSVGLFDEYLTRLGSEDKDLWLRIAYEASVYYIDKPLAFYRHRSGSLSKNYEAMLKGRLYVIDKFYKQGMVCFLWVAIAKSKIFRDVGDELLFKQSFAGAAKFYLTAIVYNVFNFWAWVNLTKAILKLDPQKIKQQKES